MSTLKCHGNFGPEIYSINLRLLNSNEILRSVWKSRHKNCVNPSGRNELKVQGRSPRTFYTLHHEDLRNFHVVILKLNAKRLHSKHWKFQISKNSLSNSTQWKLRWLFGGFSRVFYGQYIFSLEAVIFTGNYVQKIY